MNSWLWHFKVQKKKIKHSSRSAPIEISKSEEGWELLACSLWCFRAGSRVLIWRKGCKAHLLPSFPPVLTAWDLHTCLFPSEIPLLHFFFPMYFGFQTALCSLAMGAGIMSAVLWCWHIASHLTASQAGHNLSSTTRPSAWWGRSSDFELLLVGDTPALSCWDPLHTGLLRAAKRNCSPVQGCMGSLKPSYNLRYIVQC